MLNKTKLIDEINNIDDVQEHILSPQLNTQQQCDYLHHLFSKFVNSEPTTKLLDVGCGYGRHALILSEFNYDITGVDLSESAISRAVSKLEGRANPTFIVDNIASFKSDTQFDGAYAHNSVLCYVDPELVPTVLQNISDHLKPKGIFIFDYYYPINLLAQGDYLHDIEHASSFEGIDLSINIKNSIDTEIQQHTSDIHYVLKTQDQEKSFTLKDALHYWEPEEMHEMLLNNGFSRVLLVDRETKQAISPTTKGILVLAEK
ncbi:class I SAM-dependent methyltransferase [Pseudoalteromonas sp. Of7M-16]|uniref:class I SAM-dependent methyltransferase n=1 Tax=Pseudoalteromonas sp. Of7M-16 TaxID=2917756 RepID=UPI001EF4B79E|nr:class I SAM-dependent methyltransferase [Pseudoalteromonas sp. Of7M-16]MCG7548788.1 class I SAM-dependent methyltransferase [Pseudoalteromonas sp. Of7M-16]